MGVDVSWMARSNGSLLIEWVGRLTSPTRQPNGPLTSLPMPLSVTGRALNYSNNCNRFFFLRPKLDWQSSLLILLKWRRCDRLPLASRRGTARTAAPRLVGLPESLLTVTRQASKSSVRLDNAWFDWIPVLIVNSCDRNRRHKPWTAPNLSANGHLDDGSRRRDRRRRSAALQCNVCSMRGVMCLWCGGSINFNWQNVELYNLFMLFQCRFGQSMVQLSMK